MHNENIYRVPTINHLHSFLCTTVITHCSTILNTAYIMLGPVPVIEDNSLNRRHSVRQSFRQSFRNLRRASSGRRTGASFRGRGSVRGKLTAASKSLSNPIIQGGAAGTGQIGGQRVVIKCLTFTTTFLTGTYICS